MEVAKNVERTPWRIGSIFFQQLNNFLDFGFCFRGIIGVQSILNTVLEMGFKDTEFNLFECTENRPELGDDVHTVTSLDHFLQSTHLPLNST